MIIPCCPRHNQIFIAGKWVDKGDAEIEANCRLHQDEIEWRVEKCPTCWDEKIPA